MIVSKDGHFLFTPPSNKKPPWARAAGTAAHFGGVHMNNYNTNAEPIRIGDKIVAYLRDEHLLDVRKHENHFVYLKDHNGDIQQAVCIATETLRQARHANVIQVTNIEKKIKYTISRAEFDKRSFDFETSRTTGFEEQRACYLKYFASNEPKRKNYPVHIEAEPLHAPEYKYTQTTLFERM